LANRHRSECLLSYSAKINGFPVFFARSFQELIRRCFAGVLWGAQAIDNVGVDDVAAFSFIQAAVDSSSKHS